MVFVGPHVVKRLGDRLHHLIIGLYMAGTVYLSSYVENFYEFSLTYGALYGLGGGLIFMSAFNVGYKYYPYKRGLISGIIASGFGLGSMTFGYLFFYIVK